MTQPVVHISNSGGHRPSYRDLFARVLDFEPSTGPIRGRCFWQLLRAPRVLFATIDDDYAGFIIVALLRSMLRKSTCGLFLRTWECFRRERPLAYPVKRRVFRLLCRIPGLRLLALIPHELRPELREVTNDWIYDPQLWDLWVDGGPPVLPSTELSERVKAARSGRSVIIYIGAANRLKGFPDLAKLARETHAKNLVVVAGKVASEFSDEANALTELGMIVEDRWITDDELLSLYAVSDYAWCRYASNYDQASGVFGRAFQTNLLPVVREGSIVEGFARLIQMPSTTLRALEYDDDPVCVDSRRLLQERMVTESLERVKMCAE